MWNILWNSETDWSIVLWIVTNYSYWTQQWYLAEKKVNVTIFFYCCVDSMHLFLWKINWCICVRIFLIIYYVQFHEYSGRYAQSPVCVLLKSSPVLMLCSVKVFPQILLKLMFWPMLLRLRCQGSCSTHSKLMLLACEKLSIGTQFYLAFI